MKKIWITALCLIVCVSIVMACSVPVFRYALERWEADSYTLVIAHDKALTDVQQKSIDAINKLTWDEDGYANIQIAVINSQTETNSPALKHLPEDHPPYPAMFLFYPGSFGKPKIIWQEEMTEKNADLIIKSKLRKELTDEILRGRTTTWLLVESGDKVQDDKAYKVLKETLAVLQEEMVLPAGVATTAGDVTGVEGGGEDIYIDPSSQLSSSIPLQISFSIIRLTKDNKDEELMRAMLLNVEEDLSEYTDKPMVYPVFGRGRILEPLIGAGITKDNIAAMSYYLCGACSCEVKIQNPGIDLLFNVNWDAWLEGYTVVEERELPPLSGIADIIGQEVRVEPESEQTEEIADADVQEEKTLASPMKRNISIAIFLVILLLAGFTASMLRKNT